MVFTNATTPSITSGQTISIIVGQGGGFISAWGGAGGGGSYVWNSSTSTLMVVAGGGGAGQAIVIGCADTGRRSKFGVDRFVATSDELAE